jgi:hypothetical protein
MIRVQVAVSILAAMAAAAGGQEGEGVEFFEKRIRPVLVDRCYACHSAQAEKAKGGLTVDTREALLRGGNSGPAVVPGDLDRSLLIKAIRYTDEDLGMPPKQRDRLSPEQVADFESWVRRGAPDPRLADAAPPSRPKIDFAEARKFWSFRPVADPALPEVGDRAWPVSPIDRFVLARLEARGLRPGPDADKPTLLRRATFDLTGLPPSPEEIDAFLADASPDAFARVVDRLLASPHYGERWGRHWLDVVRYADTAGDNSDFPVPQARLYRDWVLRAFNEDKPFDRFVREQVAGDLLPWATEAERVDGVVATGYLAISRRFVDSIEKYHHLTIEDTIDTLGKSILGLSLGCARCHDHKYDPVPLEDYYSLYGIFQSTRYPYPGCETTRHQKDMVPLLPPAEAEALLSPYRGRLAALEEEARRLEGEEKALREKLKGGDEAELRRRLKEVEGRGREAKKKRDAFVVEGRPAMETAYAVAEGKAENARVHVKGDPKILGREVPRRFLQLLGGEELPAGDPGSGRLPLARWLTDPANPLTARVLVNRIWLHHFGKGIVATPSDFGARGGAPTHPELLDWLAARFVAGGWSIKAMHRQILLSRVYRLASRDVPGNAAADPRNDLLWRAERRRLDAEAIRDAMLAVSGSLDRSPGDAHPFPPEKSWDFSASRPFTAVYESRRRTVYLMTGRIRNHPFLEIFDGADPNLSTGSRLQTTTSLQALLLMNSPFVLERAEGLAARILREPEEARIGLAYALAFGREPTSAERRAGEAYLARAAQGVSEKEAWASYARVFLASNEFLHVD